MIAPSNRTGNGQVRDYIAISPFGGPEFPEHRLARCIFEPGGFFMPTDNDLRDAPSEPGPQPDPLLNEGRASTTRKWAVTGVIVAVLLAVMYGVTTHRSEVKDEQRQSEMQRESTPPAAAQPSEPGGRGTANAPPSPNV